MSLNPNYDSQQDRPLPVLFGYGAGSGDSVFATTDPTNNEYEFVIGFDGECDGPEQFVSTAVAPLTSQPMVPLNTTRDSSAGIMFPSNTNFHAGRWTPIGLPTTPASVGQDQCVDEYFAQIPTITPPQSLSNIAYAAVKLPNPSTVLTGVIARFITGNVPISCFGVWRGARCRYFDANGNVTGYGFTTNPTWHIVECLLRYKIKRQQPQIAGLTAAEKACFDWPSIVAHAVRNDYALPTGYTAGGPFTVPRFMGNYVFAANSTLGAMLELMLRCCRSYIDEQDGRIGLFGHDATASQFTLTANHVLPGTFKPRKKDLTRKPNVFVPKYRDLNIAAVLPVVSVANTNGGQQDGNVSIPQGTWIANFNTNGLNPFEYESMFFYGDSNNPALTGDFEVASNPSNSATPSVLAKGVTSNQNSLGGYIGTQNSRFHPRSPSTVQHRAHQKATGQVAAGVSGIPNVVPVDYDLGNMTFDQANRLMQYERNTTLGMDGPNWSPPREGSVSVRLDAVDANGDAFNRMRPGEQKGHFTIDATLSPEWQGDGIITSLQVNPPTAKDAGSIDIEWTEYVGDDAYPDASTPPTDSYRTIASATLPHLGVSQQIAAAAWCVQATPAASLASDGTMTVSVPDLSVWFLGATAATAIPFAYWTELTSGQAYQFFLQGNPATNGPWTFGTQLVSAGVIAASPVETRYVLFTALLTAS